MLCYNPRTVCLLNFTILLKVYKSNDTPPSLDAVGPFSKLPVKVRKSKSQPQLDVSYVQLYELGRRGRWMLQEYFS